MAWPLTVVYETRKVEVYLCLEVLLDESIVSKHSKGSLQISVIGDHHLGAFPFIGSISHENEVALLHPFRVDGSA